MCVTQQLQQLTSANVTNHILTITLENHVYHINGNLMAVTPNKIYTYSFIFNSFVPRTKQDNIATVSPAGQM